MNNKNSAKEPPIKPQLQSSSSIHYRPLAPREFALGNEIRRRDASSSFVPTLLPSSSLRRNDTGSQYSWNSSRSGSRNGGGSWSPGKTLHHGHSGAAASRISSGGGLSSTAILMQVPRIDEQQEVSTFIPPVSSGSPSNNNSSGDNSSNININPCKSTDSDRKVMTRISEEDIGASMSGMSSMKQRALTEENVEIFERSIERSIGSESMLPSSPNPNISPYESASFLQDSPQSQGGAGVAAVRPPPILNDFHGASSNIDIDNEEDDHHLPLQQQQQQQTPEHPRINLHAPLTIASPASVSTMDSGSVLPENMMAATARFGRLLQQCRELTETCEDSTMDGSNRYSESKDSVPPAKEPIPSMNITDSLFAPTKINPKEIHTSGRVYNASEITMDPFLKTADFIDETKQQQQQQQQQSINRYKNKQLYQSSKSLVSELSLGVDRMYNDQLLEEEESEYSNEHRPFHSPNRDNKSCVSELSLGVDRMYKDVQVGITGIGDHIHGGTSKQSNSVSNSRGTSPVVSELSSSDRRGDDVLLNLDVKPSNHLQALNNYGSGAMADQQHHYPQQQFYQQQEHQFQQWQQHHHQQQQQQQEHQFQQRQQYQQYQQQQLPQPKAQTPRKPDFMKYAPNVMERIEDDRRSWLSYTDDERTPRNTPSKETIRTFQVPVPTGQTLSGGSSNFKRRMASGTTPQQSPQSSFYSTDFSDEGSGGLLVGFGKRRKSEPESSSSSSDSDSSSNSDSDSEFSDSTDSSSSSESEEETEESEPSMPTIAKRGLRLTHQQDDDVSALSFGGASALVASAPSWPGPLKAKLPEENSRSRISESSSNSRTKSTLEKSSQDGKKERSPDSRRSKSSLSSGSGFAGKRRSSVTGAEKMSSGVEVSSAISNTAPRRATIGDLQRLEEEPQLEEESSQDSPSPSSYSKPNAQTYHQDEYYNALKEGMKVANNAIPTANSSEAPPKAAWSSKSSVASKSSKSSLSSSRSKRDELTQQIETHTQWNNPDAAIPPEVSSPSSKLSHSSRSSKSIPNFSPKRDVPTQQETDISMAIADTSPKMSSSHSSRSFSTFSSKQGVPPQPECPSTTGNSKTSSRKGPSSKLSRSSRSSKSISSSKHDVPAEEETQSHSAKGSRKKSSRKGLSSKLSRSSRSSKSISTFSSKHGVPAQTESNSFVGSSKKSSKKDSSSKRSRSSKSSLTSHHSKQDMMAQAESNSAMGSSKKSSNSAMGSSKKSSKKASSSSKLSRSSKSSFSSHHSQHDFTTYAEPISKPWMTNRTGVAANAWDSFNSRSSKSISNSIGSEEPQDKVKPSSAACTLESGMEDSLYSESLPVAASSSRLSGSSKSSSAALTPKNFLQSSGQVSCELSAQSPAFSEGKQNFDSPAQMQPPVVNSMTYDQRHEQPPMATREQSKVSEHRPLKRVEEEPSDVHSIGEKDDYWTHSIQNNFSTDNFHEYPINSSAAYDDEVSVTSSLSSVVSKARVSFQITCSASVVSALSDPREETKSIGSFRKSASDMVTERVSGSKDSVGNSNRDASNKSLSSAQKECSDGDLYEGFPVDRSDELIQSKRSETTKFQIAKESTVETDARKPWRLTSSNDVGNDDSDGFSEDIASTTKHTAQDMDVETKSFDDGSAISEVLKSQAALKSMGLYSNDLTNSEENDEESVPKDQGVNPFLLPEESSGGPNQNENLSKEIENDDESEQGEKHSNPLLLPEKESSVQPASLKTSASVSSSSQISAPSLNDPSLALSIASTEENPIHKLSISSPTLEDPTPLVLAAAANQIDTSSRTPLSDDNSNVGSQPSMPGFDVDSDQSANETNQAELEDSPELREKAKKSMVDAAKEMSKSLERSLLARSQQQPNDIESHSFEDLSSSESDEEGGVLAFLKKGKAAEDQLADSHVFSRDSNEQNECDNLPEDTPEETSEDAEYKPKNGIKLKSVAKSIMTIMSFQKRESVEKLEAQEGEEVMCRDSAASSDSDFIVGEMKPIFPDSEKEAGPPADGSDVESGFVFPVSDDAENDSDDGGQEEEGDKMAGEENSDEAKKAFWKSKYFLLPLIALVLVILIVSITVVMTRSENIEKSPTLQPTIGDMPSPPTAKPTDVPYPSVWVQVGNNIEGGPGDELGFSVSTSEQGGRFIVGSRRNNKDNVRNRGAAFIYEFDELRGSYVPIADIHGEEAGDQCGYSVSISKDGKRVAIGSLGSDKNGNNSGQVRIFDEDLAGNWILVTELLGDEEGSLFGTSVSLSQDGTRIAIGAPYSGDSEATRIGKAYVYQESDENTWSSVGVITGGASYDLLGWSVSWSPDATLLAIGAPGEDLVSSSGYVEVFEYESNEWKRYGESISNSMPGDRFGFSISFGGDGTKAKYRLAIGAPGASSTYGDGNGYACLYEFDDATWLPVDDGISGGWGEHLGYAVSLNSDANRMVVGVPNKLSNGLPSGQIQVFDVSSGLVPNAEINGDIGEDFGISISVSYDGRIIYGGATASNLVRVLGEL